MTLLVPPVQPSQRAGRPLYASSSGVGIDHSGEILLTVWTMSSMGSGAIRKSMVPARQLA